MMGSYYAFDIPSALKVTRLQNSAKSQRNTHRPLIVAWQSPLTDSMQLTEIQFNFRERIASFLVTSSPDLGAAVYSVDALPNLVLPIVGEFRTRVADKLIALRCCSAGVFVDSIGVQRTLLTFLGESNRFV